MQKIEFGESGINCKECGNTRLPINTHEKNCESNVLGYVKCACGEHNVIVPEYLLDAFKKRALQTMHEKKLYSHDINDIASILF